MKPILKCIHPLIPVSLGIFALLVAIGPGTLELSTFLPIGQGGPCSAPVFLLFFPSEFMFLLGLGFSGIRLYELRCERRKSRERTR
jgi:hypothetical protein